MNRSLKNGESREKGKRVLARLRGKVWALEDRLTVREQIAIGTAALCLVVSLAIAFGAAYVGRIEAQRLISREMVQVAETTSDRIDRYMHSAYHRVHSYTTFDNIRSAAPTEPEKLRPLFDRLNASFPDFTWLAFISADGMVRAASNGMREGENVIEESWFLKGLQAPTVGDVADLAALEAAVREGRYAPFQFVKFAFPVRGYDGVVVGVLAANIHWREAEEIRSGMARAGDDIAVMSRSGEILLGAKDDSRKYPPGQVDVMLKSKRGVFLEETASGDMLSGYAALDGHRDFPSLGWTVIAKRPASVAFAPSGRMFWTIVGIGTLVALIGIGFAGLMANRVSRPIRALADAAGRIGRDDEATMLPRQRGSSEVIHLSTSLRSLLLRLGFVEQLTQRAEQKAAEDACKLEDDIKSLRKLAETDPLTNLLNRRAFIEASADAMRYYQRYERPIAALVVDIDHFKQVNDTHGHAAGDAAIRQIAELIAKMLRDTDKVARFGGEEFVVLLREVNERAAGDLADRIRETVAQTPVLYDGKEIRLTISMGCAAISAHDRDIEELIERADRALYMAKAAGRNCVRMAPAPVKQVRAA